MNAPAEFQIAPGIRDIVRLYIGISGGSGSGKTKSAMRMATGICGRDRAFAVIDTEGGRAKHYAPAPGEQPDFSDTFRFDHLELDAPYSSERYMDAVRFCDSKGYPVIVVDSGSHEHIGEGGHLEARDEELAARIKRARDRKDERPDWVLEDAYGPTSWIKPKMARKKMIMSFSQCRATLIFCFRAEQKMEIKTEKDDRGKKKTVIVAAPDRKFGGWEPLCGKELPYEMVAHLLLTNENPGIPIPLRLMAQHARMFDLDKQLDEEAGRKLAQWALGGKADSTGTGSGGPKVADPKPLASPETLITPDQHLELEDELRKAKRTPEQLLAAVKKGTGHDVQSIAKMPAELFAQAKDWIERVKQAQQQSTSG